MYVESARENETPNGQNVKSNIIVVRLLSLLNDYKSAINQIIAGTGFRFDENINKQEIANATTANKNIKQNDDIIQDNSISV